jgi:putative thioredoxin
MSPFAFDVGTADFDEKVVAASHQVPVLVDFWAEWCGPCRVLKPVLEKLAAEFGGRFLLAKVNSDENPELSARYGVRGIPSVKAFRDGQLVDEFTGALPEGQVRAFLERIMPSPAEPLRAAAREARARGELEVAISLLNDAAEADPKNEDVRLDQVELAIDLKDFDGARHLLDSLQHSTRQPERHKALRARANLAAGSGDVDLGDLKATVEANPDDHAARLALANALALAHDYRPALEHLLAIVRRDRKWNEEAARKRMLDLFQLMGSDPTLDDLVREFRVTLARTLN